MPRGQITIMVPSGRAIDYNIEVPRDKEALGESRWVRVTWEGMPYPVEVRFALAKDSGDVVCTGLLLGARESEAELLSTRVTVRSLREVPLNDILLGARRLSLMRGQIGHVSDDPEGPVSLRDALLGNRRPVSIADAILSEPRNCYRASRLHPGRKGWPREHFEAIAEEYNEVRARNPHSPMQELAHRQHCSLSQARRWVQRAEEMGIPVNRPRRERTARPEEES